MQMVFPGFLCLLQTPQISTSTPSISSVVSPSQRGNPNGVDVFVIRQIEALPLTALQLKSATRRDPILSRVSRYTKHGWPGKVSEAYRSYHTRREKPLTMNVSCDGGIALLNVQNVHHKSESGPCWTIVNYRQVSPYPSP